MPANDRTGVGAGSGSWETPPGLFAALHDTFRFGYDPFASHANALTDTYSTLEGTYRKGCGHGAHAPSACPGYEQIDNREAIMQDWSGRRVFMNPPYGRDVLHLAMRKAHEEADRAAVIVALIPASTDTLWWHRYVKPRAITMLLQGRVQFIHGPEQCRTRDYLAGCFSRPTGKGRHYAGQAAAGPPGGSALAIYLPAWMRGDEPWSVVLG